MITEQFQQEVAKVPSRFTEVFGSLLYSLIICNRPKVIVETGTCWGYLTAWLALGAKEVGARLHTIDYYNENPPHVGPGDMKVVEDHLTRCGVRDAVTLHKGEATYVLWALSRDGMLDNLGMAMIDDEHSRAQVTRECQQLWPYLVDWGIICGHDVFDPSFVDMACGYRDFCVERRAEHLWLTQSSGLIMIQKRPAGSET